MIDLNTAAGEWGAIGRRKLMKRAGMGAAAVGAMSTMGIAATSSPAAAAAYTDADILNFALNLEYLEAEYYLRAVTGSGLSPALVGATGGVTAPANTLVPFQNPALAYYAQTIAVDELAHVEFLRNALGSAAVAEPAIDLVNSFTTLAIAAGLITAGQTFNPFADEVSFLLGSYIFEDVGVTAYAGAANLLTVPDNLSYAASVLAVEAYHAGAVRGYLSQIGAGSVTNAISALRATLSGVADDNGTQSASNPYQFNNVDANGQAYRRTTAQVLNIVYGGASPTGGLFYPNGMNGLFTTA
nr:ferritin-like domain-containing protein [uncultured Lichenicoccus sp.]